MQLAHQFGKMCVLRRFGLILLLSCILLVPQGYALGPPVVEQLEVSGASRSDAGVPEGNETIQVRAFIRGSNIARKDITVDVSQLTGNPADTAVSPLPENVSVSGERLRATWTVPLKRRWQSRGNLTVKVAQRDTKDKPVQASISVPATNADVLTTRMLDAGTGIEVSLKPSIIPAEYQLPLRIVSEPADTDSAIADLNLPAQTYVPDGCKAYRITVENGSGEPITSEILKDTFTLRLGYPEHISPQEARNLSLFVLSGDEWRPLPSHLDSASQMVVTEAAQQLGVYRLLAQAAAEPQGVFIYPNPVQFGQFGSTTNTLKFRNIPPGSIIEIYTFTGYKVREIEVKSGEVSWNGEKENGDMVTSGLYIYRIRMTKKDVFGKIAVMR